MDYETKMKSRIKRMEGQLRGILRMMEEGQDCKDVITQLSAVRSGVDRTIGVIVSENLVRCVNEGNGDQSIMNQSIQEAVNLLVQSR
ncbi:metal-sensitive transcriptional regulator [Psychrobacillus vulpis]|uniref:Metal-sensitive transcriptional regulator n=1 Tax=Psychrobacillus vulpis TaxID=2325572 RepID=A0A544TSM6_9BACI|nr:metal-sensitive transcriptional regulator [Psychrobacillus vulpis]TQR20442.1 metal-sensitive transcriptional regulator [Psychrobacillus vulpis]